MKAGRVADVYRDYDDGAVPDWYCTGKNGGTKDEVKAKVKEAFPDLTVFEDGVTGTCNECGSAHFNNETVCEDCGETVSDDT